MFTMSSMPMMLWSMRKWLECPVTNASITERTKMVAPIVGKRITGSV